MYVCMYIFGNIREIRLMYCIVIMYKHPLKFLWILTIPL